MLSERILYILDLGGGWTITFFETQEEYDFLYCVDPLPLPGADQSVIDGSPYVGWTDELEVLDYSGYSTKETGNICFQTLDFHVDRNI